MVFVRYEDFGFIFIVSFVIAFFLKDYKFAFFIQMFSSVFVVVFGLVSIYMGLGFFPNSIMAKSIIGNQLDLIFVIKNVIDNLKNKFIWAIHIDVLLLLNLLILFQSKDKRLFVLSFIFIGTTLIHASFAQFGWFFRYEAYLVIFGILNIYLYLYNITNKWKIITIYILLLFSHIVHLLSPILTVLATKNIYEQQIQMTKFLQKYKNNAVIAANDIGAITYFTEVKLLDLVGLGTYEILKLKKSGNFNNDTVLKLLLDYNVELIIVYDHWFSNINFENSYYKKIGEWKIKQKVVVGGDTVSFYSRVDIAIKNKELFKQYSENDLPKDVVYKIIDN